MIGSKEKWQRHTTGIALLITLACLTLQYMYRIRLDTSWWGILLFVSWVTTGIAILASIAAANSKTCYINLLLLAPQLFLLGRALDGVVSEVLLVIFWIHLLIALGLEVQELFTKSQVEEEVA